MASSNAQDFTDNAMLELFRAEVETHAQTLNEGLLALEKEPGQLKRLEPLMRAAHSIKGAARIVGVEDGVKVSHLMEDCFVAAQNGQLQLTSEAVDILLRGVDALTRIGQADASAPDADSLQQLLQDIGSIRSETGRGVPRPVSERLVEEVGESGKPRATKKPAPPPESLPPVVKPAEINAVVPAITVGTDGPTRVITLPGNLDLASAERLRGVLIELLDAGNSAYRLDLAAVREVDVAGLSLLAVFARTVRQRASQAVLELVNVGRDAEILFRMTGLAGVYRLVGTGS